MKKASEMLCVALDTPSMKEAISLVGRLDDGAGYVKVGLELFTISGSRIVIELLELGLKVFLDLKLHDIPNTVSGAVRGAAGLGVSLLTLHASGGPEMIRAARRAAEEAAPEERPRLLAVTVLTSLNAKLLEDTFGVAMEPAELALRLARMAKNSGADGVVCSPREAAAIREECGKEFMIVTPGIRPEGSETADQKRITTPADAILAGSDLLVVGRPITKAPDPAAAAKNILQSIEKAMK